MSDEERDRDYYRTEVQEERTFEAPPTEEWIDAKLARVDRIKGKHSVGWKFYFEITDEALDGEKIGRVQGVAWEPMRVNNAIYKWAKIMSGEEWEAGDELFWDDFVGKHFQVFCAETKGKRDDGTPFIDVIKIREPRGDWRRERGKKGGDGDEPKRKKKRRRPSGDDEASW